MKLSNKFYFNILFSFLCSLSFLSPGLSAKELRVGKGAAFHSIHDALAVADSGDVIKIAGGIYSEGEILITKPITLSGTKDAIIDGQNKFQVINIHSSRVTVEGLTVQNSGMSDIHEWAGIRIENGSDCTIKNNHLVNDFFAIYLANVSSCRVMNNSVEGQAKTEASSGNGIHIWKSNSVTVEGNHIQGHRDGIYFEFVKNSFITNNLSEKNLRYGLHFMFSDNDSYQRNVFRNNGSGVAVMYTRNVTMQNNRFEQNWGGASYGLLLKEITHSEISHNVFFKNTTGIYMEGTGTSYIHHNDFTQNGWALKLWGDCISDTLKFNNFTGNTFDVSTNASMSYNYFLNNYWDHYNGYDLNHDAIGDVPYHPVSLYSKLTENSPYALMLLHSFFIDILDGTEKMLPSVTPEEFRDDRPLMKPVSGTMTQL